MENRKLIELELRIAEELQDQAEQQVVDYQKLVNHYEELVWKAKDRARAKETEAHKLRALLDS